MKIGKARISRRTRLIANTHSDSERICLWGTCGLPTVHHHQYCHGFNRDSVS